MYIWSDSGSPDVFGALRLRFSILRYIEIKAIHCYIMQVITVLLMIEPAGNIASSFTFSDLNNEQKNYCCILSFQ